MFALSACGGGGGGVRTVGGGGGGGGGGGSDTPDALTFNATVDDESELVGAMVVTGSTRIETRPITATLDHEIRTLIDFDNGLVRFSDTDGEEAGIWQDADSEHTLTPTNSSFIYSRIYRLASDTGGGPVIFGVLAPTSVMPSTGDTTFTGIGSVSGAVSEIGTIDSTGVSTVTINWAGTVDAKIELLAPQGFDMVTIDGMTLSRNDANFTGGVVTLLEGTQDVTDSLIGIDHTGNGEGGIFGTANENEEPAEVGGVFVLNGSSGTLGGGFLAN